MTRILVVDDEPAILSLLVDVLGDEGHEVVVAGDGVAALQVVAGIGADLVITDTMMPRGSGVELIRSMREHPEYREIPVMLMSAGARPAMDGLGAITFLAKPFDLATLLYTVATVLSPLGGNEP